MIRFDRLGLRMALASGVCDPPRLLTPMVRVSRRAYRLMEEKQEKPLRTHYTAAANRMTSEAFGQMRVGAERALRAAPDYFPAYEFHVGELINDEWLAAVDWHKEYHRDHLSHQLMCVYVGRTILSGGSGEIHFGDQPLIEWCLNVLLTAPECEYLREYLLSMGAPSIYGRRDALGKMLWRQIFLESFFIACLYHDIGYPWQFVRSINDQLRSHAPEQGVLGDDVNTTYNHYKNRLVMYPFNGYQPHLETQPSEWTRRAQAGLRAGFYHTHGVPGAFALLHLNDLVRDYPSCYNANAVSRFCIEWAAMAIAMHDLQKVYVGKYGETHPHMRINFQRDPLSFLLTMTDQLQDFGRPAAVISRHSGKVELTYRPACHRVDVGIGESPGELAATFYYSDRTEARDNAVKYKKDAENDYCDPTCGYLDCRGGPISRIRLGVEYEPDGRWWET